MMQPYEKHPLEDLSDSQLDDLLAASAPPFTGDTEARILQRVEEGAKAAPRPQSRRALRLLPLVALLALLLAGFTQYDALARLFHDVFGNREAGQYAEALSGSSTSSGIRMDMLAGLHDGTSTYLFLTLTDEGGGHSLENLLVTAEQWALEGAGGLQGGNCRMVGYDAAANTATLLVHAVGGQPGRAATFHLRGFGADEQSYDFAAPEIDLAGLLAGHEATFVPCDPGKGRSIGVRDPSVGMEAWLAKDELAVEIPGFDRALLSNIGWRQGLLHIQTDTLYDTPNERLTPYLLHRATGETLLDAYSTNYDGSIDYDEHVFKLPAGTEPGDYTLCFEGWYYAESINGNWSIRFTAPEQMPSITLPVDQPIPVGGQLLTIGALELSPMSIRVEAGLPEGGSLELTALYSDGSSRAIGTLEDNSWLPGGRVNDPETHVNNTVSFTLPLPEFSRLQAILVNGVRVDLP